MPPKQPSKKKEKTDDDKEREKDDDKRKRELQKKLRNEFRDSNDQVATVLKQMGTIRYRKKTDVPQPCRDNYGFKPPKQGGPAQEPKINLDDPETFKCVFDKWRQLLGFRPEEYPIPTYDALKQETAAKSAAKRKQKKSVK
jgi:hypothetical protein